MTYGSTTIGTTRTLLTQPLNASGLPDQEQGPHHEIDGEDWEINDEDLPAGTSLYDNKALLDDYSDDETSSKKKKNPKSGKEIKGNKSKK
jgi:hypothetical protein